MLIYNKNQFEKNNLIEINYCNINDFKISVNNLNRNEFQDDSNKGYPKIMIKNNKPYILLKNGLAKINDNNDTIIIDNTINYNINDERDNYYYYINNIYYKHDQEISILEKIYNIQDEAYIIYNEKKHILSIFLIKMKNNKYIYPLNINDKYYIVEYNEKLNKWENSNITYDDYKLCYNGIKYNKFLYKLFRFDLLERFEDIGEIIPPPFFIYKMHWKEKNLKNSLYIFIIEMIKKFGCLLWSKKNNPIYKSLDLKKWTVYSYLDSSIKHIFGDNPSPGTDLYFTYTNNDTYPNMLYNYKSKKYIYYTRANPRSGVRNISVTFSDDLKNWTQDEIIRLHPPFKYRQHYQDNIYTPSIFIYESYYLGIWTLVELRKFTITYQYYISKNGIDFFKICEFHKENIIHDFHYDEKNKIIVPNSFYIDNSKFNFFSHVHSINKKHNYKLSKWSIRKDGFTSIKSIAGNISSFLTKLVIIKDNKLIINFRTEEDGYIKVQLLDNSNNLIKGYDFDSCNLIMGDDCNYIINWNDNNFIDKKQVKIEAILYKAEIFSFNCEEIYFFENDNKFNKIIYYYLEHTNYMHDMTLRDDIDNEKWKIKDLKLPNNIYATELLGKPIYENKMTLVKQKIKLSNNEIITITLEDNTDKNECEKYKDILDNPYIKKGTSCALVDIRLINTDDMNIINKDEIHVLYDENLSIEYNKNDSNIIITYSSNFDKRIGSSGFYFEISELYFQKNKFRVEFDARLINLDSEKKIKIYTGSKYIILDGNLTKNWNSFSLIEEFDFKSPSKYRINLVNPDNNLKYEIKNFAIYIKQIL